MSGDDCPCGSRRGFAACCGRYLSRDEVPPTAEALMRSRFTAYVRGDYAWLAMTHRGLEGQAGALEEGGKGVRWTRLDVRRVEGGGEGDAVGTVEFVAWYRKRAKSAWLHEVSRFERDDKGRWVYVEGETRRGKGARR